MITFLKLPFLFFQLLFRGMSLESGLIFSSKGTSVQLFVEYNLIPRPHSYKGHTPVLWLEVGALLKHSLLM